MPDEAQPVAAPQPDRPAAASATPGKAQPDGAGTPGPAAGHAGPGRGTGPPDARRTGEADPAPGTKPAPPGAKAAPSSGPSPRHPAPRPRRRLPPEPPAPRPGAGRREPAGAGSRRQAPGPARRHPAGRPRAPAAPPTGSRARLARLGVQRSSPYNPVLEPLLRMVRGNDPKIESATLRQIERAYQVAERWHRGQKRKSGDPYITHPLAVTTILAELGMDPATLMAGLLHDTVEDTEYGLDTLRKDFGDQVALLVDGVTKLDKVKFGEAAQAETVRKMVVAMAKDPRVLVIKLADRLHNMRTMRYLKREKQEKKARETLEIYAPLAHRLGMNTIKWELEDLAFAILYPKMYDEIVRLVAERAPKRDEYLAIVTDEVQADLRAARIKATVTGRPKHYYSVYQKMIVRGRDFAEIYDLVGIRVLVDTVRDCYAALGTVHARWNPVPGRFKDYIAMPKFNMYQSLHTTVIGPSGKPVELQIRTFDMHRRAEYGIAAHWKYKQEAVAGASKVRTDVPKNTGGRARPGHRQRHGVAAPAPGLAEGDRGPQRVPGVPALRPVPQRGLRLHAEGRRHSAAGRRHPGRLRVRGPHGGRPPHHRGTGTPPAAPSRSGGSSNRVRARLARLGVQRSARTTPSSNRCCGRYAATSPRSRPPRSARSSAPTRSPRESTADRSARAATPTSPIHSPWRHPRRARHDPATLMAGLLHDTVEDTEYGLDPSQGLRGPGRAAGRRGHQAGQGQVRRGRPGGDHPQDGRGHGQGHPGPGHQARRPAAQHAHACATSSGRSRRRRPARRWRSTPRWPTDWA